MILCPNRPPESERVYPGICKLMKWMEKEKPEVYKEAMEHILKELGKLKMEE